MWFSVKDEKHLHISSVTSIIRRHHVVSIYQVVAVMIKKYILKKYSSAWSCISRERTTTVCCHLLAYGCVEANAGNIGRSLISSLNFPPIVAVELCREHLIESDEDVLLRVDIRETKEEHAFGGKKFLD